MPLESSLPTSVLKPWVGTLIDSNTLVMGFLLPILILIFMQTVLLSMLTQSIYALSIFSLIYNVTHRCSTITDPISTCPKELVPTASFIHIMPDCFHSFPIFRWTSFSIISDFMSYSTNWISFTFLTPLFAETQIFYLDKNPKRNK